MVSVAASTLMPVPAFSGGAAALPQPNMAASKMQQNDSGVFVMVLSPCGETRNLAAERVTDRTSQRNETRNGRNVSAGRDLPVAEAPLAKPGAAQVGEGEAHCVACQAMAPFDWFLWKALSNRIRP
jgi:hypothetical protein